MARNIRPQLREKRKPRKPLPTLEELNFPTHYSRLSVPKKTDKQALKRIEKGEKLWDRKRKARAQLRQRRRWGYEIPPENNASTARHHLPKNIREDMLKLMPMWEFNHATKAFRVKTENRKISKAHMLELIEAIRELPWSPTPIRVWNINHEDIQQLRKIMPYGSAMKTVPYKPEYNAPSLQPERVIEDILEGLYYDI